MNAVTDKWKIEGYDSFEGGDAFYPLPGEFDTEAHAVRAANTRLAELEIEQPSASSGGQSGIQDYVYIVRPDGTKYRHFPRVVIVANADLGRSKES
jgi:hypothetical protein